MSASGHLRKLSSAQVEAFDREYVDARRLARVCAQIDADFPSGAFRFLDVGGGNGRFADQLLDRYPMACGTVLDNSETLLARNVAHPRKTLVAGSAGDLGTLGGEFDLICMHWLLHHLVGDTYRETRTNQAHALASLRPLLKAGGRVSVFENDYLGWPADAFPSWLIFRATASQTLAPLSRRLGANTAGIGVGFNSAKGWRKLMQAAGLVVLDRSEPDDWRRRIPFAFKVALCLNDVRVGHYWLKCER